VRGYGPRRLQGPKDNVGGAGQRPHRRGDEILDWFYYRLNGHLCRSPTHIPIRFLAECHVDNTMAPSYQRLPVTAYNVVLFKFTIRVGINLLLCDI
jgi:hypothetical protein